MADALLRTEQLSRSYGSLLAVDRVDLTVREGELRSIIGPNGAGKTTLFRLISGEVAPTAGLSQTSSLSAGRDWLGTRLVAPRARR